MDNFNDKDGNDDRAAAGGGGENASSSNPANGGDGGIRRTPFTELSQVNADRALARTLQEQERAYMMLRMEAGNDSDHGSWEDDGCRHELGVYGDDYDYGYFNEEAQLVADEVNDEAEDAFNKHHHANGVENDYQNSELDLSAPLSDTAYARALHDAEELDMGARSLSIARINEMVVEEDDIDEEQHGGDSQDVQEDIEPDELSYEELIALGELVGTEGRGLPMDTIASLPSINYKSQSIQKGSRDFCVVCRVDYEDGDTLTILPCKHSYHSECINKWLQISKVCPVCSTEASTSGKTL